MIARISAAFVILLFSAHACWAQGTFGNRSVGGGITASSGNRGVGLSSAGTVTAEGAISRSQDVFVGGSGTSSGGSSIRSMAGSTGGARSGGIQGFSGGTGMGGMGIGGMGMGGMGGMGMLGLGGMGGIGGLGGTGLQMRGLGMNTGLGGFTAGRNVGALNAGMGFGQTGRMGTQTGRRMFRTPLRLGAGIQAPVVSQQVVSTRLTARLGRLPALKNVGQVVVNLEGETAVLQGVVASDLDRERIARLLLLEPGINDVRNELQVNPQVVPPAAEPEPPS